MNKHLWITFIWLIHWFKIDRSDELRQTILFLCTFLFYAIFCALLFWILCVTSAGHMYCVHGEVSPYSGPLSIILRQVSSSELKLNVLKQFYYFNLLRWCNVNSITSAWLCARINVLVTRFVWPASGSPSNLWLLYVTSRQPL